MTLEKGIERLGYISVSGTILGVAIAKANNKNMFLGGVVGLASSIGLLYVYVALGGDKNK
jgi:hypothetical protein